MQDDRFTRVLGFALLLFEPEVRAWQGRAPLAHVFWVYGVLTSFGIGGLYLLAADAGRRGLQQALLIGFALYTGWILVAVWRCAEQAAPQWRTLARSLTVVWAINMMMVTGFLQLDLVAASLRI